jgi:PAS domain S-box-containing protein
MIARDATGTEMWLLSLPPTRRQTRWVIAVAACQFAALALLAPLAGIRLAEFNAFLPTFEGVIFVTDLVTSVLLFSQFAIYRLRALVILACGYLFSALMIIPHALTFPGAFSPTGLLGAGDQTAPWIYWFWHLLFSLALLGYGLMRREKSELVPAQTSSLAVIVRSVALVLSLACGLTLLATAGHDYLPVLFTEKVGRGPFIHGVAAVTMLVCVSAFAILWLRQRSVLDQWLTIVALAAILELTVAVIFSPGRFTLGFYAGRLFSLLTSTIVLVVLLGETMRLYANLRELNETLEQRVQAETRERLQIWNVSQDLLAIIGLDGKFLNINPAWSATLGWSESNLLGESYQWLLHPDDRERTRSEFDHLVRGRKTLHFENRLRAKDGSYRWTSWTAAPDSGRIYGMGRDITEQKRAEFLLAAENRCLEMISWGASLDEILNDLCNSIDALVSGAYSTILIMDPAGHQLWNVAGPRVPRSWLATLMPRPIGPCEGCCGAAAYRKERVIVADVLTDPVWPDASRRLAVENGIRAAWSEPLLTMDGEVLGTFAMYSAEPRSPTAAEVELIEGASHVALIAMSQQRSQVALRKSEQALRESERNLSLTINTIPTHIYVLDTEGSVRYVNQAVMDYTGLTLEDVQQEDYRDRVIHPEDFKRVRAGRTASLRRGAPFSTEQRVLGNDGQYRWFLVRYKPLLDEQGGIVRWYVAASDIEDRKRAEEALRELESDLAHMNRVSMMGELAASLSHEITQPIASARNNARAAQNFLDMQPSNLDEVREALGCVVGDVDRAGDIINGIREQIKKAPPRKEHFDLNAAINEVIVLARSAILKNGVSVQTRLANRLFPVQGDRIQLQQVVLNLTLNAVEAMGSIETGPRELFISTEQDQTGSLVAVRDSGPGIDPTHLERVFKAFYTTKPSGTGMGLSICRSIIEAHGGRLWAEANQPRGAVLQFTLPGAEAAS